MKRGYNFKLEFSELAKNRQRKTIVEQTTFYRLARQTLVVDAYPFDMGRPEDSAANKLRQAWIDMQCHAKHEGVEVENISPRSVRIDQGMDGEVVSAFLKALCDVDRVEVILK